MTTQLNTEPDAPTVQNRNTQSQVTYVGTLVGESTSQEFRLAVNHESIREQDIIAVDAEFRLPDKEEKEKVRVWAKVKSIERINPLFPTEAGHELAATQTSPFDTVLSLSREMVTAVCQVLGTEPIEGDKSGKLSQLRYPAQPASSAYRPSDSDIQRVLLGDLQTKKQRMIDLATLANRPNVNVAVDGHNIVTRHLAILAMTGAGKSVTSRRIIEELAKKNYPIVIFDPHGDYTGLADVPELKDKVKRYYAEFSIFDEDSETVAKIVSTLGYELTGTMLNLFEDVFEAAKNFYGENDSSRQEQVGWLSERLNNSDIKKYGIKQDLWLIANLANAAALSIREENRVHVKKLEEWGWKQISNYDKRNANSLAGIAKRTYSAARLLQRMQEINRKVAKQQAEPLPKERTQLVKYGQISVVSLAGYTSDFQATIYSLIANSIFEKKVQNDLPLPVLFVLEEAHNFVPSSARTPAESRSITTTKQIAQEGRKFNIGLVLISQRPSRLDETTLAMCNSYIIMRMINPADQQFVRKVIESLGEDDAKLLPDLDVGEAILSGQFVNFPVLVKIKPPESKGEREEQDAFEMLEEAKKEVRRKKSKGKSEK
ncbi:MAG: ATP-binding protein [Candidatus Thermochlorobacter sp.]